MKANELTRTQRYYRKNKEKINAKYREYYARERERILDRIRKRRAADPKGVLAKERLNRGQPIPTRECPELCELCNQPSTHKSLHLDHCHVTGKFRGWLCAKCNMGIGHLGDNLDGLKAAVKYLEAAE